MSAIHDGPFPRGALFTAAALVAITLSMATAVRTGLLPVAASPALERAEHHLRPIATRDLIFADRTDGAVTITDVEGRVAETVAPLSHSGFIRGVMRGLARERRMHGVGAAAPFHLAAWPDGGLSLTDLATGRTIELGAFGGTNRAAFVALFDAGSGVR